MGSSVALRLFISRLTGGIWHHLTLACRRCFAPILELAVDLPRTLYCRDARNFDLEEGV
jgi:hypothetical protein